MTDVDQFGIPIPPDPDPSSGNLAGITPEQLAADRIAKYREVLEPEPDAPAVTVSLAELSGKLDAILVELRLWREAFDKKRTRNRRRGKPETRRRRRRRRDRPDQLAYPPLPCLCTINQNPEKFYGDKMTDADKAIAKDLEDEVARAVDEMQKPPTQLKPVQPRPQTLSEQWSRGQQIMEELKRRVQRERMAIQAEFDRLLVETNTDFDKRVDDAVARLDKDRRVAIQTLVDQTADRLREHELLAQKMR